MAANYDSSAIAGVVRLAGAGGNSDSIEINLEDANGLDIDVDNFVQEQAAFIFDIKKYTPALPKDINHEDVQAYLLRAHKETQVGVLDELLDGTKNSATVHISTDETKETYALRTSLDSLNTTISTLKTSGKLDTETKVSYGNKLTTFASKGYELLGDSVLSNAEFSLDALDALLNDSALTILGSNDSGVKTALETLRNYLTLASVRTDLETKSYILASDPALKVYRQNDIDMTNRDVTFNYKEDIWEQNEYDDAQEWSTSAGDYTGRLNHTDDKKLLKVDSN